MDSAPALLDRRVSIFSGIGTIPVDHLRLREVLDRIQGGVYRDAVEKCRALLHDGPAYKSAKAGLESFTPGCTIATRAQKVPWAEKLLSCTNVLHFDFDKIASPAGVKAQLAADPHCVFAFISPSGAGVKAGFATSGIDSPERYKRAWTAFSDYLTRAYPAAAFAEDPVIKYVHALCFMSDDPALYWSETPQTFLVPEDTPKRPPALPPSEDADDYARVRSALDHIMPDDYDIWLQIGMALHASGEAWARDLWDSWSASSEKFDQRTQDSTWHSFQPDGGVSLGSVFHLAQQGGWQPPRREMRSTPRVVPTMYAEALPPPESDELSVAAPPTTGAQGALPYSDYTNALAFVQDHGQGLRYCHPWGKWLCWTGTHWALDDSGQAMRYAKSTVKRLARQVEAMEDSRQIDALMRHIKASLASTKLKALVECAQSEEGIPVQPEMLNQQPWLLNCQNGTVDLRTGALQPHRHDDLLTYCLDVAYDPHAGCPTWDTFLQRILAEKRPLIDFLQCAVGYALTGIIREHVLLVLWGTGRNGKSTFLNTLRAMLGPYAMKAPSELLMVSHSERHPTERADLYGKRFVAAIETEQGRRLAEVFVKEATGGDPIRARRMREDFWEFQPTHKVFLATNHKPVVTGTDAAIWERLRLVPFAVTIPPEEIDPRLPETLTGELPGILAWAVRGCLAWQKTGLGVPDAVRQATEGYRHEMDTLGQFLHECCLVGDNRYRVRARDLYETYTHWGGADTQRTFGIALKERGFENTRGTGGSYWWVGIGLGMTTQEGMSSRGSSEVSEPSEPNSRINTYSFSRVALNPKVTSLGSLTSLVASGTDGYDEALENQQVTSGNTAQVSGNSGNQAPSCPQCGAQKWQASVAPWRCIPCGARLAVSQERTNPCP